MRIFDSREVTATAKFAVLEDEPDWIHPEIPEKNTFICNRNPASPSVWPLG